MTDEQLDRVRAAADALLTKFNTGLKVTLTLGRGSDLAGVGPGWLDAAEAAFAARGCTVSRVPDTATLLGGEALKVVFTGTDQLPRAGTPGAAAVVAKG